MKNMKTLSQNYRGFFITAAVALALMLAGVGRSFADDWGEHHRYSDRDGFWDGQHHYHAYGYYHNHRGYWDERNGIRIWIDL